MSDKGLNWRALRPAYGKAMKTKGHTTTIKIEKNLAAKLISMGVLKHGGFSGMVIDLALRLFLILIDSDTDKRNRVELILGISKLMTFEDTSKIKKNFDEFHRELLAEFATRELELKNERE